MIDRLAEAVQLLALLLRAPLDVEDLGVDLLPLHVLGGGAGLQHGLELAGGGPVLRVAGVDGVLEDGRGDLLDAPDAQEVGELQLRQGLLLRPPRLCRRKCSSPATARLSLTTIKKLISKPEWQSI